MVAPSARRVLEQTDSKINEQIARLTEANIAYYAKHPEQIEKRLTELDEEWDIERTLEANAASVALAGTVLGTLVSRKWYFLPLIVGGFLLQHAVQGWCPPLPVFRRLGVRTVEEIDHERYALKAIRGDFRDVNDSANAEEAVAAVNR